MRSLSVRIVITVAAVIAMLIAWDHAMARGDVGGQVPSPSSCSYPAVGAFGLDGVADHYVCDYPTEINGSRHHCVYGGTAALAAANISLLVFQFSIATNVGVLEGVCYWACPDGSVAAEPNPVQTWQGSSSDTTPVVRSTCKPIGPNPVPPPPPAPEVNPFLPPPPGPP